MRERHIIIDQISDEMTADAEKQLLNNYKQSLKTINQQMADIYAKYETGGKLTYTEMAKFNRLDNLFNNINSEIKSMTGKNASITKTVAGNVFAENFYRSGYLIESELRAKLNFTVLNPKTIQASIENNISGLTLNERLQKNRADVIQSVKSSITQGLIQGASYGQVAKQLTKVFEGDATKAIRVVRTESHRNAMKGKTAASVHAQKLGVQQDMIWVATLDDRTRMQHGLMDGQIAETSVDLNGNNSYWMFTYPDGITTSEPGASGYGHHDINCRCGMRPTLKGYTPKVRSIKGDGTVPYKTYTEWAEEKGIPIKYKGKLDEKFMKHNTVTDMQWADKKAKEIIARAQLAEPGIKNLMKEIAESVDGEMVGLETSLKTVRSMSRKLQKDWYEDKFVLDREQIANSMGDAVRFTMQFESSNYSKGITATYDRLIAEGFRPYKFENKWYTKDYKGFNTNWIDAGGQKFEMQFLTPESAYIKNTASHPIYEKLRLATNPIDQDIFRKQLYDLWEDCPVPKGIFDDALKTKKYDIDKYYVPEYPNVYQLILDSKIDVSEALEGNSLGKYLMSDGTLSPERIKLQQQLIAEKSFMGKTPVLDGKPTFYMMGGGPASGKSSILKSGDVKLPKNTVEINSDVYKKPLPDFKALSEVDDPFAASFVHEESSAMAKQAIGITNKYNYNAMLDGTGDGSVKSLTKKIDDAHASGHDVVGYYCTCPTEEALWRAIDRANNPLSDSYMRKVDPDIIRSTHKKVSQIMPQCAHLFDKLELYDTSQTTPVLIATAGKGKGLTAIRGKEHLLKQFLDKANE